MKIRRIMAMTLSSILLVGTLSGCKGEPAVQKPIESISDVSDEPHMLVGDDSADEQKYKELTLTDVNLDDMTTEGTVYEVSGQAMTGAFVWGLTNNATAAFVTDEMLDKGVTVEQRDTETAYIWQEEYGVLEYRQAVNRGYIDMIVYMPCEGTDYTAKDLVNEIKLQILSAGAPREDAEQGADITLLYSEAENRYKLPYNTVQFMVYNMAQYVADPVTDAAFEISFGELEDGSAYVRILRSTTGVAIPTAVTGCPVVGESTAGADEGVVENTAGESEIE